MTAPEQTSFAGHETFPFRYTWLSKAYDGVFSDPSVFGSDDAMVQFGVGKNMVRSMRHWALSCGIVEEDPDVPNNRGRQLRVTELGERLLGVDGWDPYLEDPASLWWLHWQLASSPDRATTWYWVFNHLPQPEFSRSQLLGWLMGLAQQVRTARVSEASLKRDIDCFVRTYVPARPTRTVPLEETLDCPLVELGLVREFGARGNYLLLRGEHPSLPDHVFAEALAAFLRRNEERANTVPLDAIAFAPGSPGRVFCLTEEALLMRLERLRATTAGALVFDETAGLRQVMIHRESEELRLLDKHFRNRAAKGAGE
ncbi:MAG: DUF4007 family protein [Polyangiaceae bacterium]|nr:DUF4007 family protein [Polyangiaceae bacterium]